MSMRDKIAAAIRAYHGSPHNFDRFDLSKIGSGEGAQAYGHGLYFAENENVARSYRDALQSATRAHTTFDGKRMNQTLLNKLMVSEDPNVRWFANEYQNALMRKPPLNIENLIADKTADVARWQARKAEHLANPPVASTYGVKDFDQFATANQRTLERLQSVKDRFGFDPGGPTGKMYEVNINADPARMLNWDAPMGAQSSNVIDAMRPQITSVLDRAAAARRQVLDRGTDTNGRPLTPVDVEKYSKPPIQFENVEGRRAYDMMGLPSQDLRSGAVQATERLLEGGVPGIKYLDGMSRRAGEGTNNYVIFDPNLIDITRKYGLPFAAGTGAMGGVAAQDQYGATQ